MALTAAGIGKFLFFGLIASLLIANIVVVTRVGPNENPDIQDSINSLYAVNTTLTVLLFFSAMYYMFYNAEMGRVYYMFMIHASFFMAIMALSISTLKQLA